MLELIFTTSFNDIRAVYFSIIQVTILFICLCLCTFQCRRKVYK